MNQGARVWNSATPTQRDEILAAGGITEDYPHYTAYLVSNWSQLDFRLAALISAVIESKKAW